jgi:hypothetical protein
MNEHKDNPTPTIAYASRRIEAADADPSGSKDIRNFSVILLIAISTALMAMALITGAICWWFAGFDLH